MQRSRLLSCHGRFCKQDGENQFLETQICRPGGALLPDETSFILGKDRAKSIVYALYVLSEIGKDIVRIATAASSVEADAFVTAGSVVSQEEEGSPSIAGLSFEEASVSGIMEEEGGDPIPITQDRRSPPKFFGDWAAKQVSKEADKRKWEPGMEVSDQEDSPKKPRLEVVDGFTVVKPEPGSEDDEPIPAEQFKVQTVQEDHSDDKEFVPKVRITKVKTENVADDDCFHLRSWRTGKKICRTKTTVINGEQSR